MLKCLAYVEERSESLRGACEDLLEEQVRFQQGWIGLDGADSRIDASSHSYFTTSPSIDILHLPRNGSANAEYAFEQPRHD